MARSTLDKDLKKVVRIEAATQSMSRSLAVPGLLAVFLLATVAVASLSITEGPLNAFVILAAVVAAYMALNIGANDVANNMGPAVGSRALTLAGALVIATICEAAGAILAGGDVTTTLARDIVQPDAMSKLSFILVMITTLLAAAMWVHLATILGAPVSTTHAVVGAVVGAGAAAAGVSAVSWSVVGVITASWVMSPVLGGLMAAMLLGFVKAAVLFRTDRVAAARRWVPVLFGLMIGIFAMYMAHKGLARVWSVPAGLMLPIGAVFFVLGTAVAWFWVDKRARTMENRRKHVASLFKLPLIMAAALLSFAHGANDVANAVGPLAAIVHAAQSDVVSTGALHLPFWVLAIGAVGLSLGLALFGPRLIRTVGEKITKMDPIRAWCVALSAATTVLIASALGLPVSSTHIAVGAVFGVGFLREYLTNKGVPNPAVQPRSLFLEPSRLNRTPEQALANFQKRERRRLVRRQHVFGIAAAWIVTVPASGSLAALIYLVLSSAAG